MRCGSLAPWGALASRRSRCGRCCARRAPGGAHAPPLLIPLVGNIVAPAIGVQFGKATLGWVLFGVGGFLWFALHPILLARLVAGPPLPPPLHPTLAILLAPPAVSAIALVQVTGGHGVSVAAWALLLAASANVALVAVQTLRRAISGALLRPE